MEHVQVVSTFDSEADADRVAGAILEERLAACVQVVGPIRSRYWWQGEIHASTEWMAVFKTTSGAARALEEAIASAHPYDVPEITVIPITGGSAAYLGWVTAEVRSAET